MTPRLGGTVADIMEPLEQVLEVVELFYDELFFSCVFRILKCC